VRDNGVGFDADAHLEQTHVGLKIMNERAALIGAHVEIDARPGQGTAVRLALPAHPVSAQSVHAPLTEMSEVPEWTEPSTAAVAAHPSEVNP
jgi:two-component system nitrate/nitrite sensor histidine kinase NarX